MKAQVGTEEGGELGRAAVRLAGDDLTMVSAMKSVHDCLAAAEALAADGGMSAVAVESGKQRQAAFRYACDKRLRDALATLSDSTRHHNPWARRLYLDARARGHDHPRAIRTVGRAWSRVLWRIWHDRCPYDPARHRALQRQLATGG
jgi:hypothetical protein